MTTKITVAEHLREYLTGKFGEPGSTAVRLPDRTDLYHVLFDLLEKRPAGQPIDRGNLELVLPERSCGKRPATYNYLGVRSQRLIAKKISCMMWAEVHDWLDHQKHVEGVDYKEAVNLFIDRYRIESMSEDAFLKNYYRWRRKLGRLGRKMQK